MNGKELYGKLFAERNNQISTLIKKIKYGKLKLSFKSQDRTPISFKGFNCPLRLKRYIKYGSIDLDKSEETQ